MDKHEKLNPMVSNVVNQRIIYISLKTKEWPIKNKIRFMGDKFFFE